MLKGTLLYMFKGHTIVHVKGAHYCKWRVPGNNNDSPFQEREREGGRKRGKGREIEEWRKIERKRVSEWGKRNESSIES